MSIQPRVQKAFEKIWQEAGEPPINLVTAKEFTDKTGCYLGANVEAMSNSRHRIICVKQLYRPIEEIKDSIWHEILHILYPNMPEWWIECSAYKLAKNNSDSYGVHATTYAKTPRHNVPSKRLLLEMIRDTSCEMWKNLVLNKTCLL